MEIVCCFSGVESDVDCFENGMSNEERSGCLDVFLSGKEQQVAYCCDDDEREYKRYETRSESEQNDDVHRTQPKDRKEGTRTMKKKKSDESGLFRRMKRLTKPKQLKH